MLHARLLAEAAASPAAEISGLLLGDDAQITAALSARNVSPSPHDSFEVDPAVLIAAHRRARMGGQALIGCYHSHPKGGPTPSARDAAAAEHGALWLIVASGEMAAWRAVHDTQAVCRFVATRLTLS